MDNNQKDNNQKDSERDNMLVPDSLKPTIQTVYIDGACKNNGQADARASYGIYWGDNHPLNRSQTIPAGEAQTNNRGELWAAIAALEQANEAGIQSLTLQSDSEYVVKGMTAWVNNWVKNGWMRSGRNKEPVLNRDLWEKLISGTENIAVKWEHVKGHCGDKGNEEADSLAVAALGKVTCNQPTSVSTPINTRKSRHTEQPDIELEDRNNCLTCNKQDMEPMIQCNMCSGWIHLNCSELPQYQIYWLTNANRVYSCQYCAKKKPDYTEKTAHLTTQTQLDERREQGTQTKLEKREQGTHCQILSETHLEKREQGTLCQLILPETHTHVERREQRTLCQLFPQTSLCIEVLLSTVEEALHSFEANLTDNIFKVYTNEKEAQARAVQMEKEVITAQSNILNEDLQSCKTKITPMQQEIARLTQKEQNQKSEIARAVANENKLKNKLAQLESGEPSSTKKELQDLTQEKCKLKTQIKALEEVSQENRDLKGKIKTMDEILSTKTDQINELQNKRILMQKTLSEQLEVLSLKNHTASIEDTKAEQNQRIKELETHSQELKDQIQYTERLVLNNNSIQSQLEETQDKLK